MKISSLAVLGLAGCLVVGAPVLADWNPGDPYKMHFPQLPDPTGWDVNATVPKILADDFLCTSSGLITDVHLWGSWMHDQVGQITNMHLSIHSNIPVGPNGYSVPGPVLWSWDIEPTRIREVDPPSGQGWYDPNTGYWQKPDHYRYFQYNIDIPEGIAYRQTEGTIYWLDVQVQTSGGVWGWKTSKDRWNDDAVWADWTGGQSPMPGQWHELVDPITYESLDLAFVIAPEPTTALLLVLGGLLLRRRSR